MYAIDPHSSVSGLMDSFASGLRRTADKGVVFDPSIGFDLKHMKPGMWRVTGYQDVRMLLDGAPHLTGPVSGRQLTDLWATNDATLGPTRPVCPSALGVLAGLGVVQMTAGRDPVKHNETRELILGGRFPMTASHVTAYEPFIRHQAIMLAQGLRGAGQVDLVRAFAAPLTMSVIGLIFNLPPGDLPEVLGWADGQMNFLWGNERRGPHSPEECDQRCQAEIGRAEGLVAFWKYCLELADQEPAPESFMAAVAAYRNSSGEAFTREERASIPFNFLVAGQESTTALICSVMAVILSVPGLAQEVRDSPLLMRMCVWEVLRMLPPFYRWIRRARVPMVLGGQEIGEDDLLLLEVAAANSDASQFSNPYQFDPERRNKGIITTFGFGDHSCPGMNISLVETAIAVQALLELEPGLAPGFVPAFLPNDIFLRLRELSVVV